MAPGSNAQFRTHRPTSENGDFVTIFTRLEQWKDRDIISSEQHTSWQAPAMQATGTFLLIVAAFSYAAAELAVSHARRYRYGIEEASPPARLAFCAREFRPLCLAVTGIR